MNYQTIQNKAALALVGLSVISSSYARVDVTMTIPQNTVACSEPLEGVVEVCNTGKKPAPVDVMVDWPTKEFEYSTVTRVAGKIEQTKEGIRWHGFSLKPGERMALGVRSMRMTDKCTKRLTASVTKCTARKTKAKPQELDIFMVADACCDTPKIGPADPKADFVNFLSTNVIGSSIIIEVLANDGCADPSTATIIGVIQPQFGTVALTGDTQNSLTYIYTSVPPVLPTTDTFTYAARCSLESTPFDVTVYVTIVDPNSIVGAILQGCSTPNLPG